MDRYFRCVPAVTTCSAVLSRDAIIRLIGLEVRLDKLQIKLNAEAKAEVTADATAAVEGVTKFLGQLLGPAANEFGGMMGDQVRFWRHLRLYDFIEKRNEAIAARGLNPADLQAIGPGLAIQFLEGASYEEEDEVQQLWAELLTNAQDPNSEVKVEKSFINILKELDDISVMVLKSLFECTESFPRSEPGWRAQRITIFEKNLCHWSVQQRGAAIDNLVRLSCAAPSVKPTFDFYHMFKVDGEITYGTGKYGLVETTELINFINWVVWQMSRLSGEAPSNEANHYISLPSELSENPELGVELTQLGGRLMNAVRPS